MLLRTGLVTVAAMQLFAIGRCSPIFNSAENANTLEARAPATFTHPGVLLDSAQLNFIKSKVNSGAQPWTDAYHDMLDSSLGSLTRTPSPSATVECGPTSTPNNGCTEERQDALAAYAMSLAWYISGSAQYAQKAISYMNAWAKTITSY